MTEIGRPTKYKPEYVDQAFRLALLGLNDAEMASFFGVCVQTLENWKDEHPSFFEALTRGKLDADGRVAAAFYKRAIGYEHEAVKIFMPAGAKEPVYAPYVEKFPPDTPAIKSWLSNRQRGRWRMSDAPADDGTADRTITVVNAPEE
jgi:hypothetical protein